MTIITSPEIIFVHVADSDVLFFDFAAHLAVGETLTDQPTTPVSTPTGLTITSPGIAPAPDDTVAQATYSPSPAGTYDVLVSVLTSNNRTLNRNFVVKVRAT